MEGVHPKTGDEEQMAIDISAMLLVSKDDFREAGAVDKKMNEVGI